MLAENHAWLIRIYFLTSIKIYAGWTPAQKNPPCIEWILNWYKFFQIYFIGLISQI